MSDIGIIGGGPVGCLAAFEIVKSGFDVTIYESKHEIGIPNHCTGLIAKNGFEKIGLTIPDRIIDNRVSGAIFHTPNHSLYLQRKEKNEMLIVQRALLDKWLADLAESQGTQIKLNTFIKSIGYSRKHKNWFFKDRLNKSYSKKLLILATGTNMRLVNQIRLSGLDKEWLLPAVQFELENGNFNDDVVELFHGSKWAPGFFAWIVPKSSTKGRIGLAIHPKYLNSNCKLSDLLKKFLNKHPIASSKLKGVKITKMRGGVVPAAGPVKSSVLQGLMLVGDAAGQAKATTGGGVNIGGYCGRLAGKAAVKAINNQNYSKRFLEENYGQLWRAKFYNELYLMKLYRKVIGTVSDQTLDTLLHAAKESNFTKGLQQVNDIDLHVKGIVKSGMNPNVIFAAVTVLPDLLRRFSVEILS